MFVYIFRSLTYVHHYLDEANKSKPLNIERA